MLALNPQAGTCIGVHLGYDDVQVVVADISHNFIAAEDVLLLAWTMSREQVLHIVKEVFDEFYKANGLSRQSLLGVGISVSGPVGRNGILQRGGILPKWAGVNINTTFLVSV